MLIKSQLTVCAHNIFHLNQCTRKHFWTWTLVPFQKFCDSSECFDEGRKYVGEVSVHLQLELNVLGFISFSTDKKLKGPSAAHCSAVPREMFANTLIDIYTNQQDAQKILVIKLYFPLDALHVSDYISPSTGATL